MNGEFQSRTIIVNSADDVYQRWVYFTAEERNGVGYVEDIIAAPFLPGELSAFRFALIVRTARGGARRIRTHVGSTMELASPHHVTQWVDEREAVVLRDRRTSYVGVPALIFVLGTALGVLADNVLGSGIALTLTLAGAGALIAVATAAMHDATIRTETSETVHAKYGPAAVNHIQTLNLMAAAEEAARLAAEEAKAKAEAEAAEAAAAAAAASEEVEPTDDSETTSQEKPTK